MRQFVAALLCLLPAPGTAPIGSTIDVIWAGPSAQFDHAEPRRVGEPGYLGFACKTKKNPVQIGDPDQGVADSASAKAV